MSEPIVQSDFGGFNPRFPGVTIKFGSGSAFNEFQDFLVSESTPKNELDLTTICIRSVLDHELRHYHDFLISPYSTVIFRMRIQAAFNGRETLGALRNRPGNFLPVPLARWVTLPIKKRVEYAREWCQLFGAERPEALDLVDLPYFDAEYLKDRPSPGVTKLDSHSDEFFLHSLEYTSRAYLHIGDLTAGFADVSELPELAPYTLYEVTALAAQAQSIWYSQGAKASNMFLDELKTMRLPYARLWRRIQDLANTMMRRVRASGYKFTLSTVDQIVAISTWCLLGNFQVEGRSACPTVRFQKLMKHLSSVTSAADIATDTRRTWDHWDSETGVASWQGSLVALLDMNERGVHQYDRLVAQHIMPPVLADVMRRFVSEQRLAVEYLLAEPNGLVHMNGYCNFPEDALPHPLVRIEFDRFGIPLEDVQGTVFKSIRKGKIGNQEFATQLAIRQLTDEFDTALDEALVFESLMQWCDVVFSNHEMPSDLQMHARRGVEEFLGKQLLFLV